MDTSNINCAHSCRGLCQALEVVSLREREAILNYASLRDQCTYPDVKGLLNEIIIGRQKAIQMLEETKTLLRSRFEVLDMVQESFNL